MTHNLDRREFEPRDPNFAARVKGSFDRQLAMKSLNATLARIDPGLVEIQMPFSESFTQQHGFIHAGLISTIMDSACGYAAFSLMPANAAVLSVEFKTNLLAPAAGALFLARGAVVKPGRTITVCEAEAYAITEDESRLIATMTGTMMAVYDREGISH